MTGYTLENKSFALEGLDVPVFYCVYTPRDLPKGIVQIFHGASEHIGRYSDYAEYLCSNGFIVCGCDMPGFGKTAEGNSCFGYMGKGRALDLAVNTQKQLYDIMRSKYRYLPYIISAADIGCICAKKFIYEYPDLADGVVFSGVISDFDPMTATLCKVISPFKGKLGRSEMLIKRCFDTGEDRFFEENDRFSYISSLKDQREKYKEDAMCAKPLTVSSLKQLVNANTELEKNRFEENYPASVYTLIISGKEDPVGGYSKAAVDMQNGLEEFSSVCDIECVIFDNSRHDLFHDADVCNVHQRIFEFCEKVVDGINSARTTDQGIIIR